MSEDTLPGMPLPPPVAPETWLVHIYNNNKFLLNETETHEAAKLDGSGRWVIVRSVSGRLYFIANGPGVTVVSEPSNEN